MKSITIKLPERHAQWLRQEAARRETTIEEIVWEAIYEYEYRTRQPRVLSAAGAGSSGESDLSERIEEILDAEWGRSID